MALLPCGALLALVVVWIAATRGLPRIARISRVVDGDSLETRRRRGVHRLRLVGIDAPEYHGQPHGKAARTALARMVENHRVLILPVARDVYGRTVVRVITTRGCVSCALAGNGPAWPERPIPFVLAVVAKLRRRGQWALGGCVEPRIWRLGSMTSPRMAGRTSRR
jgi:endonuclease YncB( thermonuclease family)